MKGWDEPVTTPVPLSTNTTPTEVFDVIVRVQVGFFPEQAPVQLAKVYSDEGEAVRVTLVFGVTVVEHDEPQEIPGPVIRPRPVLVVVRVYVVTGVAEVRMVIDPDWDEVFPAASTADTVNEYEVLAESPGITYEFESGDAMSVPPWYTRYELTAVLSVEGVQESVAPV